MELWDVYDISRNVTGRIHERGKRLIDGDYHLVVHVWVMNSCGDILLCKRHPDRPQPNLWECPGGSVLYGESSLQGALREVKEETGIDLYEYNGRIIQTERRDGFNDFYDAWLFVQDIDIKDIIMQPEEVIDVKWVNKKELTSMYQNGELVPTLYYYEVLFKQ